MPRSTCAFTGRHLRQGLLGAQSIIGTDHSSQNLPWVVHTPLVASVLQGEGSTFSICVWFLSLIHWKCQVKSKQVVMQGLVPSCFLHNDSVRENFLNSKAGEH